MPSTSVVVFSPRKATIPLSRAGRSPYPKTGVFRSVILVKVTVCAATGDATTSRKMVGWKSFVSCSVSVSGVQRRNYGRNSISSAFDVAWPE